MDAHKQPNRIRWSVAVLVSLCVILALPSCGGSTVPGHSHPSPPSIAGTAWKVSGFRDSAAGDQLAIVTPLTGSPLTATFGKDGKMSGSTGCNIYSGKYTISGSRFDLGPLAVTERACVERDRMRQESAFLSALTSATSWRLSGPTLVLLNSSNAIAVSFEHPAD